MEKFPVFLEFNKSAGVFQYKLLDQPYLNNVGCYNAGKVRYFEGSNILWNMKSPIPFSELIGGTHT